MPPKSKTTPKPGNKPATANPSVPSIFLTVDGQSVDLAPAPLTSNPYSLNELRGVEAVGGLKVGTSDGTTYPSDMKVGLASVDFVEETVSTVTFDSGIAETKVEKKVEEKSDTKESSSKSKKHDKHSHAHANADANKPVPKAPTTTEEVVITLTETPTNFLCNITGSCVPNDFPQYKEIKERNDRYEKILEGRRNADNLNERHTQTINGESKAKKSQATPAAKTDMSVQATEWDIYDSFTDQNTEAEDATVATANVNSQNSNTKKEATKLDKLVNSFQSVLSSPDCVLDVSESQPATSTTTTTSTSTSTDDLPQEEEKSSSAIITTAKNNAILSSSSLKSSLNLIERAVQQNLFHLSHLKYRDYPAGDEAGLEAVESINEIKEALEADEKKAEVGDEVGGLESKKGKASLDKLFTFECKESEGRTATSMSWNRVDKDILAVGYGAFHLSEKEKEGGLIMFWSIRNPSFPEKVIRTPSGVTSIDFSTSNPNMLAVGMYNGNVAIYDTRKDGDFDIPILESGSMSSKHMDPVWQTKWVDKGPERGESLVTIATDGRVLEWSTKKGLSLTPLMVLKRVGNSDGVISRQASGLCFDFPNNDSTIYFAGTEDGNIHRCSCSYNEQYLDTYNGHNAPIYRIKCSPFHPDAFLSCSADWTVKLWTSKDTDYIFDFHSVDLSGVVNDVAWSPNSSTVFASCTGDGRVEVWDLDYSVIDPKVQHRPSKGEAVLGATPLTIVSFSENAPVLATGDEAGRVSIYRLDGMGEASGSKEEQAQRLRKTLEQEDK